MLPLVNLLATITSTWPLNTKKYLKNDYEQLIITFLFRLKNLITSTFKWIYGWFRMLTQQLGFKFEYSFMVLTGDRCTPIKKGPIHHSKQLILQISRITTILL